MDRILEWIDRAEGARVPRPSNLAEWMERQTEDRTYVQRLHSLLQRADMETRPPPREIRSFIFRGAAYELASWGPGFHASGCVWFPGKDSWIVLRRSPVMPFVARVAGRGELEAHGMVDLVNTESCDHESVH